MPLHNFASYKSGTFALDVSNLDVGDMLFQNKDMPAFVHEYCHYIQDITTISSIFGFSLWMRDVVALTHAFSDGDNKVISIPLSRDQFGETVNKFRKYYSLYCGDPEEVFPLDYSTLSLAEVHRSTNEIDLDGQKRSLAVNHIELHGRTDTLHFGLIVLQEIQAYYAQLMAERKLPETEFSIRADSLDSYPYKFGDFLFDHYKIIIGLETKFLLIDMCLDSMQAPTVFLEVLVKLQGQTVVNDTLVRPDLFQIVKEVSITHSYSTDLALENILPDLKIWANQEGREHLKKALKWYIEKIEFVYENKSNYSPTLFSAPFCMDWKNIGLLFRELPPPVMLNNGNLMRHFSTNLNAVEKEKEDKGYLINFEAATTIWSHRLLYDLLCSETVAQIKQRCECPLYEGCEKRLEINDSYTCKNAPWEIIKNEAKIICQYGMAAHSFGLWQNTLDIVI
jgi:hypothetical protein